MTAFILTWAILLIAFVAVLAITGYRGQLSQIFATPRMRRRG